MAELAWTSFARSTKVFNLSRGTEKKQHPTQKPVELYKWIFKHWVNSGDKILDTHIGSGSSRIAADIADTYFVGFELDKDYFDAQELRFKQYKAQLTLFK